MKNQIYSSAVVLIMALAVTIPAQTNTKNILMKPYYNSSEIFPLINEHAHGSTIVELPNGDLLTAWFQGSGERWADDVRIMGSRLLKSKKKENKWTEPFIMADVPGFPDINPILFIDPQKRLWLMWYTVIANQWETSLPRYRISENYMQQTGAPEWSWQDVIIFKPGGKTERGIQPNDPFVNSIRRQLKTYAAYLKEQGASETQMKEWEKFGNELLAKAKGGNMMRRGTLIKKDGSKTNQEMGYPYFRRLGWQTKNKAVFLENGRMIIPFYSDGLDISIMLISDDNGKHWQFSEPLVSAAGIQPTIAFKKNGTLVTYMCDNGPPPKRHHISESKDNGMTWSPVRDSVLPNEGSGSDIVTLQNGNWVIAYNDTEDGRYTLALSLSTDEGKTWKYIRHLERDMREDVNKRTTAAYPSIVQGDDDAIHVVYSYHNKDRGGKTIKHVRLNEEWIRVK